MKYDIFILESWNQEKKWGEVEAMQKDNLFSQELRRAQKITPFSLFYLRTVYLQEDNCAIVKQGNKRSGELALLYEFSMVL